MTCPYCNKEMESGYIMTNEQKLAWTPQAHPPHWASNFFRLAVPANSIQIGEHSLWHGSRTSASYCPDCKKIIIDM